MRVKPAFEPDSLESQNRKYDSPNCLLILIIAVGGFFVYLAVDRTMAGSGSTLDHAICYGLLICLVVVFILAKRQEKQKKPKIQEARQKWKSTCQSTELAIVSRHAYSGGPYEDGYYPGEWHYRSPSYHLELEMNADQRAVAPNRTTMYVDVRMNVYTLLQGKNTVRIYYKPDAPFTFLLEEEIE